MNAARHNPPRHGEGDRAQRGGGDSRFVARPEVALARKLRKDMPLPERMLWQLLRQRPGGFKFRRQHPIGPYVVDFCCLSERFVVEVDGSAHDNIDRAKFDDRRVSFLKENGFRVLRVSAQRVLRDCVDTADAIVARTASPLHQPAAGPPPRAREAN
ncbi:endonuclease domain-containing protein [Erythrobacter donghaensis]|uniref:endonuclease domain-containing protein n=1 Tax=Erythrobacter donghaensis TaxID=267135 RepID=UPI003183538A